MFGFAYFTVKIPDPNAYVNSQATIIQYSDGTEVGRIGSENRTIVKLAAIPLDVRHAVLAAEDRNFYSEHALDRKSTRLNSSHSQQSRMPSSA